MKTLFIDKYLKSFTDNKRRFVSDLLLKQVGDQKRGVDFAKELVRTLDGVDLSNDKPVSNAPSVTELTTISSSLIQGHFRAVTGDIIALLLGYEDIDNQVKKHIDIVFDFMLKNLDAEVQRLEKAVNRLELMNRETSVGFSGSISNFDQLSATYSDATGSRLLYDQVQDRNIEIDDLFTIANGKYLYFPYKKQRILNKKAVSIDKAYPQSLSPDIAVDEVGSDINNLLDNDSATTYASHALFTKDIGAYNERFELSFISPTNVNQIRIVPATADGTIINNVLYSNDSVSPPVVLQPVPVHDPSILGTRVRDTVIIDFADTVEATRIYIDVSQDTYSLVNFDESITSDAIEYSNIKNNRVVRVLESLDSVLQPAVTTSTVDDVYYEYSLVLADIVVAHYARANAGYYISNKVALNDCSLMGVSHDLFTDSDHYIYEHTVDLHVEFDESNIYDLILPMNVLNATTHRQLIKRGNTRLDFPIDDISDITFVYADSGLPATSISVSISDQLVTSTEPKDVIAEYTPVFVKYPQRKYGITNAGKVAQDYDNTSDIGFDETFALVFYRPYNKVEVRHRFVVRTFDSKLVRVNNIDLLYSINHEGLYRL